MIPFTPGIEQESERQPGRRHRDQLTGLWGIGPILALALVALATAPGSAAGQSAAAEKRAAELELALGPGVRVSVHEETNRVRFVGATRDDAIGRPPGVPASAPAERVARAFLERYGTYFGLGDRARELRVGAVDDAPRGRATVRFQELREGVPVLGGELIVNLDRDGDVLSASGEVLPSPSLGVKPRVGASAAERAALEAIAKEHEIDRGELRASTPELWIYDSRLLGGPGLDTPLLTWRFEVTAPGRPIRELVLVDARLGSVALHFNQIAHGRDREVCDAGNAESEYPCTAAVAERSEGDSATGVADVDDAYDYSGDTYDFFFDRFGRDSLDGAGMTLFSTVRYCPAGASCPYENAFWDGEQMVYGEGFAVDDVVGHELTHGVTDSSSRLFYYYQSGAISESFSDVFGELVDLTNGAGTDSAGVRWLLGEDIPGIGAIRDLQDPPAFGDPDRMTSPNYTADASEGDAGGVHTNSGVNNKAAYLMTDGDTFNGRTVTGLGITKVARIYYEVETNQLTSASDYADLYDALNQACTNLIGTDGITASDCTEVDDAALAVEMSQEPPAAPAPEAPTCTSGTPVDVFFDDLENPASGNWTLSTDVGVNEWYYPPTSNPYGFDATYATSGTTNFWGYNRPATADFSIEMASDVTVPASGFMRFEHAYGFEDSASPPRNWDGSVVEYSTNGGSSWTDAGSLFVDNGYTGTITSVGGSTNPLGGRSAFVGESNGYIASRLDLSSLAGQDVRFRFRIGTDSIVDDYGWFVDDIRIYHCGGPDTDPPETTITSGPSGPTSDATPTFGFSSDEGGSSFECRFDSDSFGDCSAGSSHTPPSNLTDGAHTLEVRATDPAGNTDQTPASRSFTVDTDPPSVSIDSGPSGPTTQASPTFGFTAEGGATVECSIDTGAASFGACSDASSHTPDSPLSDDSYTFRVRASDAAGNQATATRSFTVDTDAPQTSIDAGPSGPTSDVVATFEFSSNDDGSAFECRFDSGSWSSCSSPKTYASLPDGAHEFEVRAIDQLDNADPSPAARSFTVDTEVAGAATGRKAQRQRGHRVRVKATVGAQEALSAKAKGKIKVKVKGERKSYKLKPTAKRLEDGGKRVFRLKPKRRDDERRIVKALGSGRKATAKLTVELTDQLGNTTVERLSVKLRR